MFELTVLTSGPRSNTLIVALYYNLFASGIRAPQAIDAMAVIYALSTLVLILIALRFVNPTQLVSQVRQEGRP
jgi:putative spermidine/putrescine transport system permease protein